MTALTLLTLLTLPHAALNAILDWTAYAFWSGFTDPTAAF